MKALEELKNLVASIEDEYKETLTRFNRIEAKRQDSLHIDFEMEDNYDIENMTVAELKAIAYRSKKLHDISMERRNAKNDMLVLERLYNELSPIFDNTISFKEDLDNFVKNKLYRKRFDEEEIKEKENKRQELKAQFVAHGTLRGKNVEFCILKENETMCECILRQPNAFGRDGYSVTTIRKEKLDFYV